MAQAPPPSARQHQSWRDKRQVPHEAVGQSRRLRRWFFSLLGLLMVAGLAWEIYNIFRPQAIVALLPVTSYHELIPPVRFGANDYDRLKGSGLTTVDLREFQTFTPTILKTISQKLREQHGLRPKDTLIVYVSAHGVSDDGEAFLLGSKAMEERQSWAKLEDFLASLADCKARRTIVFLDAGHLPTDPRQGMIVNEFPELLAKAVEATGNSGLWVLTSCGMHEFSHVSYRQEQTVFGYFVAEGLAGAADRYASGNNDHLVDLAELADYVAAGVSHYVQQQAQVGSGETQTPRLLWGGGSGEKSRGEAQKVEFPRWHDSPPVAAAKNDRQESQPAKSADKAAPSAGVDRRSPAASAFAWTRSSLKKGTGPEPSAEFLARNAGREVPVPRFQQIASPDRPSARFALVNLQDSAVQPQPNPTPAPGEKPATDKAAAIPVADQPKAGSTAPEQPAAKAANKTEPAATPSSPADKPPAAPPPAKDPPPATTPDKPAGTAAAPDPSASAKPAGAAPTKPPADAADQERQRPRRDLLKKLAAAWRHRDDMLTRPDRAWSPIDFAPHVWRDYEETLLSYEARCVAGRASDWSDMLKKLNGDALDGDVLHVNAFRNGTKLPPAKQQLEQDTSRYDNLRQLWDRFDRSAGRGDLETGPDAVIVRAAWELRNDCLFRATDLLRWHARASLAADQRMDPNFAEIQMLLGQIGDVDEQLRKVTEPNSSADAFERLGQRTKQLRGTWETLLKRFQGRAEQLVANPGQPGARRELADLLATPLLSAERRIKLLEAQLSGAGEQPLEREVKARPPATPPADKAWQRAQEQAMLEVALLRVVDLKKAQAADAALAADSSAETPHAAIRNCAHSLAEAYRRMPVEIESIKTATAAREADLRLRLVDGRDAGRVSTEEQYNLVQFVRWKVKRQQDVALSVKDSVELSHDSATSLEVTVTAPPGYSGEPAVVELRDPGNRLDVTLTEPLAGVKTLSADTGFTRHRVPLTADHPVILHYQIRPRSAQIWSAELKVGLEVGGKKIAPLPVLGTVRRPQQIDLVVMSGAHEPFREAEQRGVRLRPFANRATEFRLGLQHQGGQDRKVRVQLYGIKLPLRKALQIWTDTDKLPDAKQVTEIASLDKWTLKGGEEPQALAFTPPKPDALPVDAKPADAAAPTPAKPAPILISGTLVCLVQDLDEPPGSPPYATWLDVTVRHPRDYVTPNVSFDRRVGELSIDLTPGDAKLLSARADDPIHVAWDTAGQIPPDDVQQSETTLESSKGFKRRLWARVEPGPDKRVEVRLSVDGYPRAFVYEDVECDVDHDHIPPSEKLERVRIAPHVEPDPKAKNDAAAPPKPKTRMAYKAPLEGRKLWVDVAVDAPDDAFQHYGASGERGQDELQVGIDLNRDRLLTPDEFLFRPYPGDRQIDLAVVEVTPEGGLVIDTKVRDFTIPLSPVELHNKEFVVLAQLSLAGSHPSDMPEPNSFPAIIDGVPPKVDFVSVPRSVEQGEEAELQFEVVDQTDIAKVFFVVDRNGNGEIDGGDGEPVNALQDKGNGLRSTWRGVWKTTEKDDRGTYSLLVQAEDEVGNKSLPEPVEIQIKKKSKPSEPLAAKGSIKGVAHFGQFPLKGKVEIIEGPKKASKAADREGKFQFDNLPPGDYTLKAEGGAGNYLNLVGKTPVITVPPEGGKIEGVVIELDKAPKPPPIPGAPPPK